ncbi:MAG: hypothetical protein ABIJ31_10225 [Pseudomonadota bacterium]
MIDKSEIMEFSRELGLRANVVEKDYVLGWVLAGIFNHPVIGSSWVFKGGIHVVVEMDILLIQSIRRVDDPGRCGFASVTGPDQKDSGRKFRRIKRILARSPISIYGRLMEIRKGFQISLKKQSDLRLVSQVFKMDDIFNFWQISAGYFK